MTTLRGASKLIAILAALAATLIVAVPASAAPAVDGEFPLPAGITVGANNEIVEGPDGNMWVTTEQNAIVRIAPDGTATKFEPAGMTAPASGIVAGPDGNLWAAQSAGVIMIPPGNPTAAAQTNYGVAGGQGITVGPEGSIWFAATGKLIQIPPANPAGATQHNVAAITAPKGMTTGSDGLLWVADGGGNVISATAANPPVTNSYATGGGPQDVAAGPNAQVAYANPLTSPQTVGRIVPGGTPEPTTLENTDPFGVVFGQDGAYWIARSQGNDLLRLTRDGNVSTLGGFAPSGGVGPRKLATGPNKTLWVTLDTPEKVARVTGVEPGGGGGGGAPNTELTKAPKKTVKAKGAKAKVKFKFSSRTAGARFDCSLRKKGKQPRFRACNSPKRYKLKPGKYTFQVRAVAAGAADPSPAKRSFKVVEA